MSQASYLHADLERVQLLAPAKLTLTLRITGIRPDGYHLIEAEMVSLDLADTLEISSFETGRGVHIVSDGVGRQAGDDDLVVRALAAVNRNESVTLTKRIPAGAGLGGGSSDAAAILRWARCKDTALAVGLGADVPFCVAGGRAFVNGIGDIVTPAEYQPMTLTLLTPAIHASTPVVYKTWDAMGGPSGDNGNDLEPAALVAYPRLSESRDSLSEASGKRARLAGSGSTWFVEGAYPGPGHRIVRTTPAFDYE